MMQPNEAQGQKLNGGPVAAYPSKKASQSENTAWARGAGATRFDPILPRQYQWQAVAKRIPLEVSQIWSWLHEHTVNWAALDRPSPSWHAIDREGNELHVEAAAAALGIDEANARRAWRWGERAGIWGNQPNASMVKRGDKYRGRRRMYLYGDVDLQRVALESGKPEPQEGEENANEKVCTDLFGASIWKQIKDRPKEILETWIAEEKDEQELAAALHADLVAGFRAFIANRQDNRWAARGVKVNHQEHVYKNGHAAAHGERKALVDDVYAPTLFPLLEVAVLKRSVQTSEESVQSSAEGLDKPVREVSTGRVSLLPQTPPEKIQNLGAGERICAAVPPPKPPIDAQSGPQPGVQGQEPGSLPEKPRKPANATRQEEPELTEAERNALDLLFLKTREMQNLFPHTKFGEDLVSPENKADQIWARRVLAKVGPADMEDFCYQVRVDLGIGDKNSLGKLPRPKSEPARNPHDRYLGLIIEWAKDWKRGAASREKRHREDREAKERIEALMRAQNERAEREQSQWARVEAAWAALDEERRQHWRQSAKVEMDGKWKHLPPQTLHEMIERRAKQLLRDEAK